MKKSYKNNKSSNKIKKILFLLTPIVVIYAFYTLSGKVSGDIFIVTNARSSIKLSDVKVSTVSKKIFSNHMLSKKADLESCPSASDENEYLDKLLVATRKRMGKWYIDDLKEEHKEKNKQHESCITDLITSIIYSAKNTTRTDSNGLFEISVPRNETIVVIVSATRTLPFGGHEKYLWVKPVNLEWGFSSKVQLSNNNLINPKNYSSSLSKLM